MKIHTITPQSAVPALVFISAATLHPPTGTTLNPSLIASASIPKVITPPPRISYTEIADGFGSIEIPNIGIIGELNPEIMGCIDNEEFQIAQLPAGLGEEVLLGEVPNLDVIITTDPRHPILEKIQKIKKHLGIIGIVPSKELGISLCNKRQIHDYLDLSLIGDLDPPLLKHAVTHCLHSIYERTRAWKAEDPFSTILNQGEFSKILNIQINSRRSAPPSSLAVFKIIFPETIKSNPALKNWYLNDLAKIFKNHTRNTDVIGRAGETEFLILFGSTGSQNSRHAQIRIFNSLTNTAGIITKNKGEDYSFKLCTHLEDCPPADSSAQDFLSRVLKKIDELEPGRQSTVTDKDQKEIFAPAEKLPDLRKEYENKIQELYDYIRAIKILIFTEIHDLKNKMGQNFKGMQALESILADIKNTEDFYQNTRGVKAAIFEKLSGLDDFVFGLTFNTLQTLMKNADKIMEEFNRIIGILKTEKLGVSLRIKPFLLTADYLANAIKNYAQPQKIIQNKNGEPEFIVHTLAKEGNPIKHTVTLKFPSKQEMVIADPGKLSSIVLMNLLNNSLKYTQRSDGIIEVCVENAGSEIEIKVYDNGRGITAKNLGRVFREGDRAGAEESEIEGSGVGLSTVKQIVEAFGGSIKVESAGKNKGTTVTISLKMGK